MSDKDLEVRNTQLPAEDLGAGFEDMEGTDFSAPFLVICQANSPYLNPTHQLYIEDCKQSNIVNTSSMQCYQEVNIIPVKYAFKNVEWKPRNTGGGFVGSYYRDKTPEDLHTDPMTGRIVRSNGNEILPTAYYLCMLQEEGFEKVIIPFYSTQLKKSRKWNTLMFAMKQQGKALPMFSHTWKLSTVAESNNKGSWYGWKIETGLYVPDLSMDIYNTAKELSKIDNFLPERLLEAQSQAPESEVI